MNRKITLSNYIIGRAALLNLICAMLILLFTYASASKLLDVKTYYGQMNNQPMPNWMTPYLVWGIPSIELIIVGMLMFDKFKKVGLWSSLLLMSTFTIYVSLAVFKIFAKVPCSCGGVLKELGWTSHLYFNLFFTAISLVGIYLIRKAPKNHKSLSATIL